jgi:hypothetical protein
VTFVHLACSGARIDAGLLDGYAGFEPAHGVGDATYRDLLAHQVDALKQLLGHTRTIDALIINIGANAVGWGPALKYCAFGYVPLASPSSDCKSDNVLFTDGHWEP